MPRGYDFYDSDMDRDYRPKPEPTKAKIDWWDHILTVGVILTIAAVILGVVVFPVILTVLSYIVGVLGFGVAVAAVGTFIYLVVLECIVQPLRGK